MGKKDDLFDWKHLRLWRFASLADVFSAGIVVVYGALMFGEVYNYNQIAHNQFQTNLVGLFSRQPIYIFVVSLQTARILVQGLFYYLMLKGIALGLSMIVETDINYRDNSVKEGENE